MIEPILDRVRTERLTTCRTSSQLSAFAHRVAATRTLHRQRAPTKTLDVPVPTRITSSALSLVFASAAILGAPVSASAGADTTPPVLSAFDFAPKSVDIADGAKTVTVTARVTDETGAESVTMILDSDATTQTAGFGSMSLVSGTPQDGVWSRTATIPATAAPGAWSVVLYPLSDTLGNSDSAFRDNPTKLTVTNGVAGPGDTAPPVVSEFDFTPKSVDIADGAKTVSVTARLTDQTGAEPPTMILDSDATTQTAGFGSMSLISGTPQDGVWSRTATIPATAAPGTWAVVLYPVSDTLGNSDSAFLDNPTKLTVSDGAEVPQNEAPGAPTGVLATRSNASARVSWAAPRDTGGAPITSYTVTASPGGQASTVPGSATSAVIAGLSNGTAYTFVVTATNAAGQGAASTASGVVVPATTPARVAKPTVKVKRRKAVIRWAPPADGGAAVTTYRVSVNGKSVTRGAGARSLVLKKLKPGRYRVKIAATNGVGNGPASQIVKFTIRRK